MFLCSRSWTFWTQTVFFATCATLQIELHLWARLSEYTIVNMRQAYVWILVCALGVPSVLRSQSTSSAHWKVYRNANYNFSLRYPATDWSKYEGFDRNGVRLASRDTSKFHLRPEIGAGGAVGQPSDADESRSRSLNEDFQAGLEALKEYGHARNLVVLNKVRTTIQGLPAIVSTIRYQDSSNGSIWLYKEILAHAEHDSPTYHLELLCSPDDAGILIPLFDEIAKTFRILGPPA